MDRAVMELDTLFEGVDFFSSITRSKFEELNEELFKRCMLLVKKCLRDAKMDKGSIDHIILVGGSTKIPQVAKLVHNFFNRKELLKIINPEEAVAYGASILAAILSKGDEIVQELHLLELNTVSIGAQHIGSVMTVIIPKNTPLPTKSTALVTTIYDLQWVFRLCIYEGEALHTCLCKLLDVLYVKFQPDRAGVREVCLYFEMDADGILSLSSEDLTSGKRRLISLNKDPLPKKFARMALEDSNEDEWLFKMRTKIYVERYCHQIRDIIKNLAAAGQKNIIEHAVEQTLQWIENNRLAEVNEYCAKEEIVNMVMQAEKYQCEHEERKDLESKKVLEKYCLDIRNNISKMASKLAPFDKKNIRDAIEKVIDWLDEHQFYRGCRV